MFRIVQVDGKRERKSSKHERAEGIPTEREPFDVVEARWLQPFSHLDDRSRTRACNAEQPQGEPEVGGHSQI